jgi:hypothetical protein
MRPLECRVAGLTADVVVVRAAGVVGNAAVVNFIIINS